MKEIHKHLQKIKQSTHDEEVISHDSYILAKCLQEFAPEKSNITFEHYYTFILHQKKKRQYMKKERIKIKEAQAKEIETIPYKDNAFESIIDREYFSHLPEPELLCISLVLDRTDDLEKFLSDRKEGLSKTSLAKYLNTHHGWPMRYTNFIFNNITKTLEIMRSL